ncbi:hypothetical protein SKAU_G00299270 [Synaphobranchus kaupii]|uniref:Nuclear body protein SP140-like protein n=1 Tax=Synaphobranchus kaupii TaxID=118154 RepID=A0A9Q1IMV4_SYNKA|nr:hypothetical protein SKAU_G00299270 [Synaphobranchus kaupii]
MGGDADVTALRKVSWRDFRTESEEGLHMKRHLFASTKDHGDVNTEKDPCEKRNAVLVHPNMSELRIVLLGRSGEGKSKVGNIILGREAFETEPSFFSVKQQCDRARGQVDGRHVTVINTPDILHPQISQHEVEKQMQLCVSLSDPGPHVLLLVLQPERFTEEDSDRMKRILHTLDDQAFKYTMVLVTHEGYKTDVCIDKQKDPTELFIEECRGRHHRLNNIDKTDHGQIVEFMEKINMVVKENDGRYLTCEIYKKIESGTTPVQHQYSQTGSEQDMERENKPQVLSGDNKKKKKVTFDFSRSFHFSEDVPENEETSEECKKEEEEKKKTEWKKSEEKRGKKRSDSVEEEPGSSTQSTPSKRKKLQKPSYRSPIRKGVKELPVSSGDKKGSLHPDKLARGEKCILAEGHWFTPSEFEAFGGQKRNKKWKTSIHYQNTPLQKLFQEGKLKSPNFHSRRSLTRQRKQRSTALVHTRQSEHNTTESDTDLEEEGEEEDEEEEKSGDQGANGKGDVARQDDVDMSQFPDARLSVTCGSASGSLQKDRFASGISGKCIRTASRWLTPVEFAREDPTLANSFWKKSILCQGKPLSDLIEREVLVPHSLQCVCKNCSKNDRDQEEQKNDDYCSVCGLRGRLLCCDQCPRAFHSGCHLPIVDETMLGEQWLCTHCILTESQHWRYACDRSLTQALENRISDFMLQCQHLLLQLYNSDEQHIFSKNPCATVPRYRDFIKNPMWLDKVAEKLQNRQYSSVGQFVSDVHLIFENCATFNRDNEFGQMGARFTLLFEKEFQCVFSVKN